MSPMVEIKGISKSFGQSMALSDIDLSIEEGQFFALVGPSGSGNRVKSNLPMIIRLPQHRAVGIGDGPEPFGAARRHCAVEAMNVIDLAILQHREI